MIVNKQGKDVTDSRMQTVIPIAGVFFKFLLFNAIWCYHTTFTPFSSWESYATALVATLVLSVPYILTRRAMTSLPVMAVLDIWMVANLMYYRTYFSAIPPSSYLLVGNLADFLPSVTASFRWFDLLFPISTVTTVLLMYRKGHRWKVIFPFGRRAYFMLLISLCTLLSISLSARGGFLTIYRGLKSSAHLHASGPPLYTLFGTLYFDYAEELPDLSEEQEREIHSWLSGRPTLVPLQGIDSRDNCIVILAESLESWVLNLTVENQEITPHLNKFLREPSTLYAPHVLTQVNGGRSIDGQLLVFAGLLPLQTGAYSCRYPLHSYHTLPKAMKELKATRNYLLTVDKTKTWNQGAVARSFGIDTIISYPDFRMTEVFGNRKRLGDKAFFAQCSEKIENGEIWRSGENVFIQMVTYSGHSPFKMPESLKSVHFSDRIPEVMNNYMTVAHYTDEAIGKFVEFLKTRPEYERTMIVITGDHEGLADNRKELCFAKAGKGIVSEKEFTPLIILNAPISMHYSKVMGQVDIYPTLLNLLGLESYRWSGIGQSILDPRKPGIAIGPKRNVEGDTLSISCGELLRMRRSPVISDWIIRFDKLKDL
jgi:phosphoglycerol transferase MdoB-like AlkP superfamily enzyme